MTAGRTYEVRVSGLVPSTALADLGGIEVARPELRTVLSGSFPDQAALYGFLNRLRSLGLDVVEVRQVATTMVFARDEDEHDASTAQKLVKTGEQ